MTSSIRRPDSLSLEHIAFITSDVAITAASRDMRNVPSLSRSFGCRVTPDATQVSVLLARTQSAILLRDIQRTGTIAIVFSKPSTHRTLQIKGSNAKLDNLQPGDIELAQQHRQAFADEIRSLGYPASFGMALHDFAPEDLVAACFTPDAIYVSTPGPQAGKRLEL